MFDFLKPQRPENQPLPTSEHTSVLPNNSRTHSDVRRELIRVVLKDTLRLHAIPYNWLNCKVIIIERAPGNEELHIQLVIMKWNEQLLRYAPALQQQLLLGLDRFAPSEDHSHYIVSWRFSPDCGCPFDKMPDPKTWLKNTPTQAAEEPLSLLDRRKTNRQPA